jgi:hypothetical protein
VSAASLRGLQKAKRAPVTSAGIANALDLPFPQPHLHHSDNEHRRAISQLAADLNSSCSPAVARHDAMRNEVTIAAPFRVVAAETGGVAAPAPETTHAPGG